MVKIFTHRYLDSNIELTGEDKLEKESGSLIVTHLALSKPFHVLIMPDKSNRLHAYICKYPKPIPSIFRCLK